MQTRREFLTQTAAAALAAAMPPNLVGAATHETPAQSGPSRTPGIVQTVLGPLDASKLGVTLPHEHICVSSAGFWRQWPEFFGGRANFIAKVVDKLKAAKDAGVDTIVDVTPADIGRDALLLQEVSRKSGVHLIACTGHWLNPSLSMEARTVDELTDFFLLEIERGLDGTDIKPGVIKVATDREVTPFIDRVLRAAARASKKTGTPVTTHTFAPAHIGEKQADIFEAEGLHPSMVCLGHSDDANDLAYFTGLLKRGYTLGMDHLMFGLPDSDAPNPQLVSWQQRAANLKSLLDAGFSNQLFLSNDWYFGISIAPTGFMLGMEKHNPDGMLFIARKVLPHLKQIGVTDQQVQTITIDNPRRFFANRNPKP